MKETAFEDARREYDRENIHEGGVKDMFNYQGLILQAKEVGISEADIGTLVCAVCAYETSGLVTAFSKQTLAFGFVIAKSAVDAEHCRGGQGGTESVPAKAETLSEKRSRAARESWKKRRARKEREIVSCKMMQNDAPDLHILHHLQYVRTNSRTDSIHLNNSESVSESVDANHAKMQDAAPALFEDIPLDEPVALPVANTSDIPVIIGAADAVGVKISRAQASKIIQSNIPRDWLSPPKSFLMFIAEYLRRNDKYKRLEHSDPFQFRRLFMSAASNKPRRGGGDWSDLRDEYLAWLDDQLMRVKAEQEKTERERAERERAAQEETARNKWLASSDVPDFMGHLNNLIKRKRERIDS
ncbi:MAG: hypothetical protein LBH75_08590 [Treponema sp.]|jgi:hypothetical protein|nr:hypothetical protein [Treponema sp.]